ENDLDTAFVMSVDRIDAANATLPAVMISHRGFLRIQSSLNDTTARILCLSGEAADDLFASSGKTVSFRKLGMPTASKVIAKDKESFDDSSAVADVVYDLHVACRDGDHAACQRVLAGVEGNEAIHKLVNASSSSNGLTALHHACAGGNDNVVELLLKLGGDFDAVDLAMQTPLHVACANSDAKCARLLLRAEASAPQVPTVLYNIDEEHGGLATRRNIGGGTAMHEAARAGSPECVELLLSANARVESAADGAKDNYVFLGVGAKDVEHNTPLHAACANAHAEWAMMKEDDCNSLHKNGVSERLLIDRVESPNLRRDLEVLYLRHEAQNAKQSTLKLRKENERVVKRIESLEDELTTLHNQVDTHTIYEHQIQQLQLQMQMILQFQMSYGKHASSASVQNIVTGPLLAMHSGDTTGKSDEELALDAGLARDLGKKCLRQSQGVLAEKYFLQSLELMPLPGVNRLLDSARKLQDKSTEKQFPTETLAECPYRIGLPLSTESPPRSSKTSKIEELVKMAHKANATPQARLMLDNELNKLRSISDEEEFALACRWVEWIVALPWGDPNTGPHNDNLYAIKRNEFQQLDLIDARRIEAHRNQVARIIQRTFRKRYAVHLQTRAVAASRIQAVVRGKLARQSYKADKDQLLVARKERSDQVANQQVGTGVIAPLDVDYSTIVDPVMQRKLPHDYDIDKLIEGVLFATQQRDCIKVDATETNMRVLQLVKCVKADAVISYKSKVDKKHSSFFVWTRWGTDMDKLCACSLCGPYEDRQDAQRRFDRIAREEARPEAVDRCVLSEGGSANESGFDFLRNIVGVGGFTTSA
ncbi:Ankyrin repeat-containing protein, partial [Phytophthora palmivora]